MYCCMCSRTSRGTNAPPKMYLPRMFWDVEIGGLGGSKTAKTALQTATQILTLEFLSCEETLVGTRWPELWIPLEGG